MYMSVAWCYSIGEYMLLLAEAGTVGPPWHWSVS
jgi:hypothetical protein